MYCFSYPTGYVSLKAKVRVHGFSKLLFPCCEDFVSASLATHEDENTMASRVISSYCSQHTASGILLQVPHSYHHIGVFWYKRQ